MSLGGRSHMATSGETEFRTPSWPWHVFLTRAGIPLAIIRGFRPEQVEKQHRPLAVSERGSPKPPRFLEMPGFPGNARVSRNLLGRRLLVRDHGGNLSWPTNPIRTIRIVSRTILIVPRLPTTTSVARPASTTSCSLTLNSPTLPPAAAGSPCWPSPSP